MKTVTLDLDKEEVGQAKMRSPENIILREAKIKILAYKGAFQGLADENEIARSKKGQIPHNFDIHYLVPLSCKNAEIAITNMVVMEKKACQWLRNHLYQPSIRKCGRGNSCVVYTPELDVNKVVTFQDIRPFIESYESNAQRFRATIGKSR